MGFNELTTRAARIITIQYAGSFCGFCWFHQDG